MCKQSGNIFNIQRFSTSDGPGIRTTVFFKGCPLNCAWCHNPESKSTLPQLFFKQALCIGCGACTDICSAHRVENHVHHFDRKKCLVCGRCAAVCPTEALEMCGETKTTDEIMSVILRDIPFYQASGGGITLSGGEPLMQYGFALALLKEAKKYGIHTAVETCGYTVHDLREMLPFVDLWLYDIKLTNEVDHIRYTGVSDQIIRENLHMLSRSNANIILRCPIIPDVNLNESHFDALAALSQLHGIRQIHIEPYHPLGIEKAAQLDKTQTYSNGEFLKQEVIQPYIDRLRNNSRVDVLVL